MKNLLKRSLAVLLLMSGGAVMAEGRSDNPGASTATFAGGCFWCMEPPFDQLDGVISTTSGYAGGEEINPSYKEVVGGRTGHTESIQISYDPAKVDYQTLLAVFWRNIDPTAIDRQFVDVGRQYRSAIFYHNEEQRQLALESREALATSGRFDKPIITEITPLKIFYKAEEYHQDYYQKNPIRYKFYRHNSGRDQYLMRVWKNK